MSQHRASSYLCMLHQIDASKGILEV
eukprot:COSAG05_NODE_18389_length_309_cov_0.728571_1_plen_25_part_10